MKLFVVILNYRSAEYAIDCLRTLAPEIATVPGTRVVVPDNASGDGSHERIAAAIEANGWSSWASARANSGNEGYAAGNNEAIRPALAGDDPPQYVYLLNPDTVVRAGSLATLVRFMDENPRVGIAGSRLEDGDGTQHASRYRFHTVWSEIESGFRLGLVTRFLRRHAIMPPHSTESHAIDWVAGASMIVRREVFERVGLLDAGYFLYFEETDFCKRAAVAGWPCWYVPDARVAHLVGKSSQLTQTQSKGIRRPRYWFESRRRYFVLNHGLAYAFACDVGWAIGFGAWRVRRVLQRKPDLDPPHLWWDFVRYNFTTFGRPSTPRRVR